MHNGGVVFFAQQLSDGRVGRVGEFPAQVHDHLPGEYEFGVSLFGGHVLGFRSRFEWGLIADIQPPDYETRMAILRKNAESCERQIDEEIIKYIATNIKSNIRELEGAFNKIIASAKLNQVDLTLAVAEEALKDVIYPNTSRNITPSLIREAGYRQSGPTQTWSGSVRPVSQSLWGVCPRRG